MSKGGERLSGSCLKCSPGDKHHARHGSNRSQGPTLRGEQVTDRHGCTSLGDRGSAAGRNHNTPGRAAQKGSGPPVTCPSIVRHQQRATRDKHSVQKPCEATPWDSPLPALTSRQTCSCTEAHGAVTRGSQRTARPTTPPSQTRARRSHLTSRVCIGSWFHMKKPRDASRRSLSCKGEATPESDLLSWTVKHPTGTCCSTASRPRVWPQFRSRGPGPAL